MRVLVTGASGFVGSHIVSVLVRSGHEVRAFVRSKERLERALAPFSTRPSEVHIGDVTDPIAVASGVADCERVVHAANVYSYDPRKTSVMSRTNVEGTQTVISAAAENGCDRIIYISTSQVTWPRPENDPDPVPLASLAGHPYSDSKKRAEAVVREWQDRGAPVVITYPGGVFGPHDPGPGEQLEILRALLVPTAPFRIDGGFPGCDVDWVASVHAGLLKPGSVPPRVTCTGTYLRWGEWFEMARDLTGRSLPQILPAPGWLLAATGMAMDTLQRVIPARLPFGHESGWILMSSYGMPDEAAIEIAGPPPAMQETFERAVRWAFKTGHLTASQVGQMSTGPR